jgi:hypothetical protein
MTRGKDTPTPKREKEARKRTWRRASQDRTRQSKVWTLREFGGKTVWDWMQLLIVPLALVLIGFALSMQQDARQQAIEAQRAERERDLEEQRAQDAAVQAYLDQMSTLLLERDLSDKKVQILLRARTLAVLEGLDPSRKKRGRAVLGRSRPVTQRRRNRRRNCA